MSRVNIFIQFTLNLLVTTYHTHGYTTRINIFFLNVSVYLVFINVKNNFVRKI